MYIKHLSNPKQRKPYHYAVLLLLIIFLYGSYVVLRYSIFWSEGDTAVFSQVFTSLNDSGHLAEENNRHSYSNGYAYQVWSVIAMYLTSVSIPDYIHIVNPILGCLLLGYFVFILFRTLLQSYEVALLATMLVFLVPELTFTVFRGNHEKFTLPLTFLVAFTFFKALLEFFAPERQWFRFGAWLLSFYFLTFTLASVHLYFGSTFIVGSTLIVLTLIVLSSVNKTTKKIYHKPSLKMVLWVSTSWIIIMLLTWYIYDESSRYFSLLERVSEKLGVLFLTLEAESNPYSNIGRAWLSPVIYSILSAFRWWLFGVSFVAWLIYSWIFLRFPKRLNFETGLLTILYGSFGVILVFGLLVDLLGLEEGVNWQVRLYVYFAAFSAPMAAKALVATFRYIKYHHTRYLLGIKLISLCGVIFFSSTSLLKSTGDPIVANHWRFFDLQELQAINFYVTKQNNTTRFLWIGPTPRLRPAYTIEKPQQELRGNKIIQASHFTQIHDYALDSPLIRASASAINFPLPTAYLDHQIYNNGQTQIYKEYALTPFEN